MQESGNIENDKLLTEKERLIQEEQASGLKLLQYIAEIKKRNLHKAKGHETITEYCEQFLHISPKDIYGYEKFEHIFKD